ncbi:MAG: chromate efflux transporter [Gammaproteobacteria bacterium]|nr:chromate efflux transporter [Gammaproteobacteria bacterium]MCW8987922.1 chromate efflux transporter [Gammaproteobacteria bacterium]
MSETSVAQEYADLPGNAHKEISLFSLFLTFLKIGSLAFGGYMALISVIENTVVKKLNLINHNDMLDGVSLANLLPGPMAVNVVAFVGYKIRGRLGALVTTTAVILPSFLLILGLSYVYFNFGEVVDFKSIFLGFMPAVAAIVFSVAWRLGKKTITGKTEVAIAIVATLILFFIPLEYKVYTPIALIFASAVLGYYVFSSSPTDESKGNNVTSNFSIKNTAIILLLFLSLIALWFIPLPIEKNSILYLTLTFASMSLMLFGGGYVFIPIIGSIVILENGWLTSQEFTDGIALGQVTPGPILISATFIGYKVAGFWGALCSTIGIFGIPAILMVVVSRWFDFISKSSATKAVMHGIHCAVIGMIGVAAFIILQSSFNTVNISEILISWPLIAIFLASLIGLIRYNLDVVWIIPPAGLIGYLFL